jgi:hypothetical protein
VNCPNIFSTLLARARRGASGRRVADAYPGRKRTTVAFKAPVEEQRPRAGRESGQVPPHSRIPIAAAVEVDVGYRRSAHLGRPSPQPRQPSAVMSPTRTAPSGGSAKSTLAIDAAIPFEDKSAGVGRHTVTRQHGHRPVGIQRMQIVVEQVQVDVGDRQHARTSTVHAGTWRPFGGKVRMDVATGLPEGVLTGDGIFPAEAFGVPDIPGRRRKRRHHFQIASSKFSRNFCAFA